MRPSNEAIDKFNPSLLQSIHIKNKFLLIITFVIMLCLFFFNQNAFSQDGLRGRIRERWRQRRAKKSQDFDFSIKHGGLERKYKVHIPSSYDKTKKTPLVIYLHGGAGSIKAAYADGMDKQSDKFGFILTIPAGTGPIPNRILTWNGGKWQSAKGGIATESCCGYAAENNIDDVGFISEMIEAIKNNFNIDEKRIYATGISNGAIMSYRLACELSHKVAAVAAVAPPAIPSNCAPAKPVSVMHIIGTADPCVPIAGGGGGGCASKKSKFIAQASQEMVDNWVRINNCSASFTQAFQKGDASCISYRHCNSGSEVEFCTIKGAGHAWPSGAQYLPARVIGPVSYDLSFEQIWDFFERHPKK